MGEPFYLMKLAAAVQLFIGRLRFRLREHHDDLALCVAC